MAATSSSYVQQLTNGAWRVSGTRVSLDSIVHAYWQGRLPEAIAADFPSLTLEQIHGAIAFYLGNQDQIDSYIEQMDQTWREFQRESERQHGPLLKKIREMVPQITGS